MFKYYYHSPIGKLLILATVSGIRGLYLEGCKYYPNTDGAIEFKSDAINEAIRWLDTYFNGEVPNFIPKLDLVGTEFQLKVWNELLKISYGSICSYGDIALHVFGSKKGCQSVGSAVSKNPIMIIIPCHRVVGSKGELTGFSAGLNAKVELLKLEHNCAS